MLLWLSSQTIPAVVYPNPDMLSARPVKSLYCKLNFCSLRSLQTVTAYCVSHWAIPTSASSQSTWELIAEIIKKSLHQISKLLHSVYLTCCQNVMVKHPWNLLARTITETGEFFWLSGSTKATWLWFIKMVVEIFVKKETSVLTFKLIELKTKIFMTWKIMKNTRKFSCKPVVNWF